MSTILATAATHYPGWGGPGWGGGPGPALWFLLIPLLWIVVFAILFAVFGRRWRRAAAENGYGPHGRLSPQRSAQATLAQRFAKGDIDETEYRARLEVLRTMT
ncbi:SHOCT domain-containing protein [Microbacterium sp. RD1]|uniref:SHOCT domain-containing protein n=1 Tax=Microbacterium sp. RD1 TaxID=3457313 RepID=UPI003FA5C8A9